MKVALFGAGRIGPLHARTLLDSEDVDELVIMDVVHERAVAAAQELGARAAATIDAALEGVGAVVITASTDVHPRLISAAMERGLPTFCEKPLAPSLTGSIAVRAEIDAAGVPFQLGFQRRFDPAFASAKELVVSGAIGDVYLYSVRSHDPAPASEAFIASSGGIFRDLSIHDIDVLRFLSDREIDEVYVVGSAAGFPIFERYGDLAYAVATLRLADGTPAVLSAARHDPAGHDVRAEIFGSRDSVSVGLGPRMPLRSLEPGVPPPSGPPWHIFLDRWDDAYRDEMRAFIDVALGRRVSPCTAHDGVEAMRVAEAMTLSAREHRVVTLAEIDAG